MIQTVFGLLVLFFPWVLVFLFDDKFRGFVYISVFDLAFHVVLAIVTQSLHIFTYPVIIAAHGLVALAVAVILIRKRRDIKLKRPGLIILIPFFAFIIIGYELSSVHYNYTGIVVTAGGIGFVNHDAYSYPLFSDEWVNADLARYSIENKSLPLVNPLIQGAPDYANLLTPYDSLTAELFLSLGLDPISEWSALAVAFGLFMCMALYILMRKIGIGSLAAAAAVLCIPFLAEGGNLPGIWFLLPYTLGTLVLLVMLTSLAMRDRKLAVVSAILSLILYPPMMAFVIPTLCVAGAVEPDFRAVLKKKKKIIMGIIVATVCAAALAFVILSRAFDLDMFSKAVSFGFFHQNIDRGIVSYALSHVVPIPILIFAAVGLLLLVKSKRYILLTPMAVGLAYWIMYAFVSEVLIIEYTRIVAITALLLIVPVGIGIEWILIKIPKTRTGHSALVYLLFIYAVATVIYLASIYPVSNAWSSFILHQGEYILIPGPPVNRYLKPDDLKLFSDIHGARFVAPPWKGLVIGVATGNYPLQTKSATIGTDILSYADFMNADCATKTILAKTYSIEYAYSEPFDCPDFSEIGNSAEKLHLYMTVI